MIDDDEYVDTVLQGLKEARSAIAQFLSALDQATQLEPSSDVVSAVFDADGYLLDLFIDPVARAQFTHTELENLITSELHSMTVRTREAMNHTFQRYFGAGSAFKEIKALADDF